MVWISTDIREEHRQAIDSLNDVTREDYNFFAVRIELLQIGEQVAPDFVVVASPKSWQKRLKARGPPARAMGDEARPNLAPALISREAKGRRSRRNEGPNGSRR
jgi:hypothetical protein